MLAHEERGALHTCDAVVVGGGVFGAWLALDLARRGLGVVLLERESRLLRRASYNNQARLHNGYHYPRSILTGLRSRVNSGRFWSEFEDCVDTRFQMYYAIARRTSNVTAAQFRLFCERIQAPLVPARDNVAALFEPSLIESVFKADEWAFDADRLAARLATALEEARVDVRLSCTALALERGDGTRGRIVVRAREASSGSTLSFGAGFVFNCAYAEINALMAHSNLPKIPLKQELAEIALVTVPPVFERVGVTVMCGPFFSVMPFPALGVHSLSHVRYTPHHAWADHESAVDAAEHFARAPKRSNFTFMQKDAQRYLPVVAQFVHTRSLWELKTLLPSSEADDSRPILFKREASLPGLTCVLGGKIDNVFDMEREVTALLAERGVRA